MSKSTCRYVEGWGYYTPEHRNDCRDNTCAGCVECTHDATGSPVRHCTTRSGCTGHLNASEALTCARCVGRVRRDLAMIEELADVMIDEAVEQGVNSEAAYLAGPATSPRNWAERKEAIKHRAFALSDETYAKILAALPEDDPHHPLLVLGRWDMMLREDYDQPTTLRVSVSRSVAYLDGLLTRLAQDDEQDWPLFAREVAECRSHLEAVLHDSRAPERGRPCPTCSTLTEPGPPLVKRYADYDRTGASDTWRCPWVEEHKWSEGDYRLRVSADYVDHAPALTVSQLVARFDDLKPGSVRGWASKGEVNKRGKDEHGRQLYDVADVARKIKATRPEETVA